MWNLERFFRIQTALQKIISELLVVALIAEDGSLLLHAGENMSDQRLIGTATAALARLSDHISGSLGECDWSDFCIHCQDHSAMFFPVSDGEIFLLVVPSDLEASSDLRRAIQQVLQHL